jgi:hypothetical protein
MANEANLIAPWKPGETGNPKGHSAGRRKAKKLREALDIILEGDVPDVLLQELPAELLEAIPDDVTFAEIIAMRVAIVGARAQKTDQILSAANLILGAQTKPDLFSKPVDRTPPVLPSTEERRQSIAEQLGLDVGDGG